MSSLKEGDPAPDFELPEASERIVRLSEEVGKGPVVLIFYPTDWGMVCTMEMKTFQAMQAELERIGARLLGISVNSTTSHRSWKEQMNITWDLLSDHAGKVSSRYGILIPDGRFLEGHAQRAVFIIDRDGRICYAWIAPEHAIQPDYDELLEAVKQAASTNQSG